MRKGKNHVESFFKNIKRYEMEFPDQKMKKYKNTRIPEMPMSKLKKIENSPSSKISLCGTFMVRVIFIKFQIDIHQKKQEQKYLLPLFLHIWKTPTKTEEDTFRHIIAGDYFQSLILSLKIL